MTNEYEFVLLSDEEWHTFWSVSPQRSAFTSNWFLAEYPEDFERAAVIRDGAVRAAAVLTRKGHGTSPAPYTMYQGLLLPPVRAARTTGGPTERTAVNALLEHLIARHQTVCLSNHWRLLDLRPFSWFNFGSTIGPYFDLSLGYTAVLDLESLRSLEDALVLASGSRRRAFRKAASRFAVEPMSDPSTLIELHRMTLERGGGVRPESSDEVIRAIASGIRASGQGDVLIASRDGQVASAALFLYDDRTAYYLFGANNPQHLGEDASTLLLFEGIRRAIQRGLTEFDFVGANSPNRGDFKLSFGGCLRAYHDSVSSRLEVQA